MCGSLILSCSDNILNHFRKLCHIFALDIATNFHGIFQFFEIRLALCQNNDDFIVGSGFHPENGIIHGINFRSNGDEMQCDRAGQLTNDGFINSFIIGEIVFSIPKFFADKQFSEDNIRNCFCNNGTIYRGVPNFTGNILFIVCQKSISIACSGNIVLRYQSIQGLLYFKTGGNLIRTNIFCHENADIVHICLDIVYIAYEIQEFQDIDIILFNAIMMICCILATVNDMANGTVQECVKGIIKQIERNKCIFIFVLDCLSCFLKAGKHGAFAAGEMLSRVSMLSDFRKNILHQAELIGNKRISFYKFALASVAL